jgi:hypothetical protein
MPRSDTGKRDQGAALVMVLVLTITLGIVATALARYATVGLTYSSVVRDRADRLAAADGGMRYMIEKMRLRQTLCTTNAAQNGFTSVVPPSINGSTISVTCDRIGTPISDTQSWALIVTGNGVPANEPIFETQSGGNRAKSFGGPVFMSDPTRLELKADAEIKDGDLWYTGATCPVPAAPLNIDRLTFTPAFLRGPLCTTKRWDELFTAPTLPPAPDDVPPPTPIDMSSGCRVFFPGKYTPATTPQLSPGKNGQNYFVAGDYYFEDVDLQIQGTGSPTAPRATASSWRRPRARARRRNFGDPARGRPSSSADRAGSRSTGSAHSRSCGGAKARTS